MRGKRQASQVADLMQVGSSGGDEHDGGCSLESECECVSACVVCVLSEGASVEGRLRRRPRENDDSSLSPFVSRFHGCCCCDSSPCSPAATLCSHPPSQHRFPAPPLLLRLRLRLATATLMPAKRVLVYGGRGALGRTVVSFFKQRNWVSGIHCPYQSGPMLRALLL